MEGVLEKIAAAVASGIVVAVLTLVSSKVRNALFYKGVEYEFAYTKGMGPVEWDIEWEGFRLTLSVQDVSNDFLGGVKIERHQKSPFHLARLEPSDKFLLLFDGEIQLKLDSIVRRAIESPKAIDYVLRFVFRRRWLQIR